MSAKSDYLEQKIIEAVLKNTTYTAGASVWVALFTVAPGETGGGTEVTGGSYARQAVLAASGWSVGGQVTGAYEVNNAADITYPTATANWGTIVAFGLYDASVGGNLLYFGNLTTSKTVNNGDTFKFPATNLKIAEA